MSLIHWIFAEYGGMRAVFGKFRLQIPRKSFWYVCVAYGEMIRKYLIKFLKSIIFIFIKKSKMIIDLNINNSVGCHFDKKKLKLVIANTIEKTYLKSSKKRIGISIAFISEKEIKKINKKYRNKNSVTDILSFAEYDNKAKVEDAIRRIGRGKFFLGELLVCCDDISKYVSRKGLDFEKELWEVFSHGVLHLLGYSHSKEMFAIQKSVAGNI